MFPRKRTDTLVSTVERTYGVDLHARSDMLLGNLLHNRGFNSLSQLLAAYNKRLIRPARVRKIFLSFHIEDLAQVNGFRLMARNQNLLIDFNETSTREPVQSQNSSYIKKAITAKIARASVVACMIGNGTALRDWVDWELCTAIEYGKGVCGIRLKGAYGRAPEVLTKVNAPVAKWDMDDIIATIEAAAARGS